MQIYQEYLLLTDQTKKRCDDCCNVFLLAERKGFEPLKRF